MQNAKYNFSTIAFIKGRWFVTMNFCVHALMYGYYALRALQYRIPKSIAMVITTLQIVQMIFGGYVCFYALQAKVAGEFCEIPMRTVTLGVLVYIAMLIMFAQFFVRVYIWGNRSWSRVPGPPRENGVKANGVANGTSRNGTISNGTANGTANGDNHHQKLQ